MVGYSRLVGLDEAGAVARLRSAFNEVLQPLVTQGDGRVVNTAGDSALAVFPGAGAALRFALDFQQIMAEREAGEAPDQAVRFRVGVTVADVLAGGADVHGEGVNVAARLQAACPSGAVCVSRAVRDQVGDKLGTAFEPLGLLTLKNIARPIEAYVAHPPGDGAAPVRWRGIARRVHRNLRTRRWKMLAVMALLAAGTTATWKAMPPAVEEAHAAATALPDLSVKHAPRLSLVVLPFANTSGDPGQDYLADAVTDDLTTDLARLGGAFVIGRGSAQTDRGRAMDARQVGRELGVRYLVQGSVRRLDDATVRVNAELVSTETGKGLWAERFDQEMRSLGEGQSDIVRRLAIALETRLVDTEAARSLRERPEQPDVFDLVMRARSLLSVSADQARAIEAEALFERALAQDPTSVSAMVGLAERLVARLVLLNEGRPGDLDRAAQLLAGAEALRPDRLDVIELRAYLRRGQGRLEEAITAYQQVIAADPNNTSAYAQIAVCRLLLGQADMAVSLYREAIRRDPRDWRIWARYSGMGQALLRLKQPADAIVWLTRAVDNNTGREERSSITTRIALTSALAHAGQMGAARRELAALVQLSPYMTVRGQEVQADRKSPVIAQNLYVAEGLRLAGLRDHVDEDADASVPSTGELHPEPFGPTPISVPGAAVIRTDMLQRLLTEGRPLVLDLNATGRSLPGAVVLDDAFVGGSFDDAKQERLRRKMQALTGGELMRPIVTLGWNAERWGSRNLTLRLAALGYARVHWYRGGKEVWEAHGLPETDADKAEW